MAVNMNMDMGAIISGMMGKKGGQASPAAAKLLPFRNAALLLAATALSFGLYTKLYYMPTKQENLKKKQEIERLTGLKEQTVKLDANIEKMKETLGKSKEHYIESLSHFGNSSDLGQLYQSVSTLAGKYELDVLNIKEVAAPPPKTAAAPKKAAALVSPSVSPKGEVKGEAKGDVKVDAKVAAKAAKQPKKPVTEVKEIMVEVELKGRYGEYIKFKEDLAIAEMLLKINSENIKVKNDKADPGSIFVTLNLSTYAIDKKPFENIVGESE